MGIKEVLELILGLCLFLFGMNVMGESLERSAGNGLRSLLGKLTNNKFAGFLTGLGVTAVIQSSTATIVSFPSFQSVAFFGASFIKPFNASVVFPLERASSIFPTVINARIMAADSK